MEVLGDLQSMPHARSVITKNGIKVSQCRNNGLLRTFHAYKRGRFNKYERSPMFQYFNLRLLAIQSRRGVSSLLSSLSLLWNLHTIIISRSHESPTIPDFWKMPQLRHVEFVGMDLCLPDTRSSVDMGDDDVIMENLHTLKGVRNFKCSEEVVKRIPNIKKLQIWFDGTDVDANKDISNMELLCKLESFHVQFRQQYWNYCEFTFSHSLKKVFLQMNFNFECEEMMEKMGWLPLLEKFTFHHGCFRTTGKWEIAKGQFPSLKYLALYHCFGLEHWVAAEDSENIFPRLQKIHLWWLENLKSIPPEIGEIPTLERMFLHYCSEAAVKSAKEIVDEQEQCQGDELPFRVEVAIEEKDEGLLSLANPNFEVRWRHGGFPKSR